jgi:ribonucleoside-diphosphate reductase alpha chain
MQATKRNGSKEPLSIAKIQRQVEWACSGLNVSQSDIETRARLPLHDGVKTDDIQTSLILSASSLISPECPDATKVAARFLLQRLYKHANDGDINYAPWSVYAERAVANGLIDAQLNDPELFDLDTLQATIDQSRDFNFDFLGLKTLADRYLLRLENDTIIELPQHMFMRVAMGVALAERDKATRTAQAVRYYNAYSTASFINSTPTLFNSGTPRPQLSSCFGTFIDDSIDGIMDGMKEVAQYSKFSGGCSADFTPVRARGSYIKSTRGKAGGPIPYIKIYNDTLIGFDQSGKRKGSGSCYLEMWHADIVDYLRLREPGDDRLRAHDVFPALWIPDLFMQRAIAGESWSLFSPSDVPQLHETFGKEFEALYVEAEAKGLAKATVNAEELWITALGQLFTHGVFWPCWKDTINYRYAQPEVVHQSNLCTEITLRNDPDHSFVCNLGSINLGADHHLLTFNPVTKAYEWNSDLEATVRLAIRNLDSVITVGTVPHENGSRMQHEDRPIGLGVMGWTEALYKMGIDYESAPHIHYANEVMRQISMTAIDESANLAQELGSYPTFARSKWAQGILPVDTLRHTKVIEQFGLDIASSNAPFGSLADLREKVKRGMRNSTLTSIAPTATIANILNTTPCTELPYQAVFVKKNLSGTFNYLAHTVVNNPFGLPFKSARDVNQLWTVWAAAARQIWLCQSQSTNYYLNPTTPEDELGDYIRGIYEEAWAAGVKTSYYLHGLAEETAVSTDTANLITVTADSLNGVSASDLNLDPNWSGGRVCSIDSGPSCEACQ